MNAPAPANRMAQIFDSQFDMEEPLQKIRDIGRAILQIGTHEDVVRDDRDQMLFITLVAFLGDLVDQLEDIRWQIRNGASTAPAA